MGTIVTIPSRSLQSFPCPFTFRIIDLAEGEKVVGVARLAEKEKDEGNKEGEEGNVILLTDPIDEE